MPKFVVIDGTPAPDTPAERVRRRIRAHLRPDAMIQCHRCGGRETIAATTGVLIRNGRTRGGTKQLLCAACLMRGERVVLA